MWRRLMRKTMAPGRPLLFMEQWGLALLTILVLGLGIVAALGLWR